MDVSPLTRILSIDPGARTATVEGQVPLASCAGRHWRRASCPRSCRIPTFTVAGLVNGEGLQSSSHRYGVFSRTITALEIVLGDSSVVVATPSGTPTSSAPGQARWAPWASSPPSRCA